MKNCYVCHKIVESEREQEQMLLISMVDSSSFDKLVTYNGLEHTYHELPDEANMKYYYKHEPEGYNTVYFEILCDECIKKTYHRIEVERKIKVSYMIMRQGGHLLDVVSTIQTRDGVFRAPQTLYGEIDFIQEQVFKNESEFLSVVKSFYGKELNIFKSYIDHGWIKWGRVE